MEIRNALTGDFKAICRICCKDLGYECSEELVRERLENIDPGREAVFVACENGEAVGFIQVETYKPLYFETLVNILGLAVSSECRRQGVGKALFERAEKWAAGMGAAGIRLTSGSSRSEAHCFYRAMGCDGEKDQKRFLKIIR